MNYNLLGSYPFYGNDPKIDRNFDVLDTKETVPDVGDWRHEECNYILHVSGADIGVVRVLHNETKDQGPDQSTVALVIVIITLSEQRKQHEKGEKKKFNSTSFRISSVMADIP